MRSSWLYFATRSERAGAPVLIWPQLVATARSAIVVSSVSPERWLIMQRKPLRWARSTASRVSVSEPIWLTLTSSALADCSRDAAREPLGVGDEQVVADDLDLVAELGGHGAPAVPVVLVQRVLDGDDRVRRDELGVVGGHLVGRLRAALEGVAAVVVELGGRHVERERDVVAERVAGLARRPRRSGRARRGCSAGRARSRPRRRGRWPGPSPSAPT